MYNLDIKINTVLIQEKNWKIMTGKDRIDKFLEYCESIAKSVIKSNKDRNKYIYLCTVYIYIYIYHIFIQYIYIHVCIEINTIHK